MYLLFRLPSGREGYPLNGGCKVHGRSTENIYPEYTKLDQVKYRDTHKSRDLRDDMYEIFSVFFMMLTCVFHFIKVHTKT